jgi:hypothetical protein
LTRGELILHFIAEDAVDVKARVARQVAEAAAKAEAAKTAEAAEAPASAKTAEVPSSGTKAAEEEKPE